MPRKTSSSLKHSQNQDKEIEINLPKFSLPKLPFAKLRFSNYTPLLVIGMIIASFFLGMETSKIQYLQLQLKNGGTNTVANAVAPANQQPTTPPASGNIKPVTNSDIIRGNVNAKVTLVEYSDEECPFCKSFHPTMKQLMTDYGDKVRWVYRTYPLPFHQNADKEAQATLCVNDLGGNDLAWNFIDKIFERTTSNGTGFSLDALGPLAAEVGVDQTAFQSCLDSNKFEQAVKDEEADGTQAGVQGTPTTIILADGKKPQVLVGALPEDQLKTAIDAALK
ncbi:MAG TPA: DsbA family protein [Patescibacteria group bacterium]|nr:DsbA family protein [Patescibacteria group bacterium]